ncbi:hypothetical protein DFQ04_2702 [Algoriphagus boseongensis]|uniref:Uncharacterized protein n=2 Tax=Algoriphagus boseongensis TaxID=1442587 RepID=A0A4R6T7C3_9BACT|nr:hypothetical protein DFQ04_2702 [Algoriphagus boseongensis]
MIMLLVSLPAFGIVYLYHNSGNLNWDLPKLPGFWNGFFIGSSIVLLIGQYFLFHQDLKKVGVDFSLFEKVRVYSKATVKRFFILFCISVLSTIGLLLNQGPVYIVVFAVCLVFFSLGKPSPDRLSRLLKLKKEDRELLREVTRPQ